MENYTLPVAQATGPNSHCIHTSPRVHWSDVVAFRCTWEHLGAHWITVEQSGKNIFFGNAAGEPGNHSYYVSFNDFQNLCIQFVFSSMYLCINRATNLQTVYLDWQHAVIQSNSRCAGWWLSSELRDTLSGRDRASLELQLETEIEWTQSCTGRLWSSGYGHALGGRDRGNSEMHSELWSNEYRDALAAGYDRGRLEEYMEAVDLEAVDGRRASCWDSIDRLVNSKPWECDEATVPLKLLWNRENEGTTDNLGCMLYSVYAALGVCCTQC